MAQRRSPHSVEDWRQSAGSCAASFGCILHESACYSICRYGRAADRLLDDAFATRGCYDALGAATTLASPSRRMEVASMLIVNKRTSWRCHFLDGQRLLLAQRPAEEQVVSAVPSL